MALQNIDRMTKSSGNDWLDLRLFNNESNIGFASKKLLGNNVPIIILLIATAICGILRILYSTITAARKVITAKLCIVICCFTIPLFVVSFFQAGKSSVLPPFAGIAIQQWGLCTQGVILPRHQVPRLISELRKREHTQPDIVIKFFALKKGLQRFVLNPMQVQHLGKILTTACNYYLPLAK
jgi:hypothetical protein